MAINKTTLNYRKQAKPYGKEDQPMDAYVVANYGDPGLTESSLFDFLSRFVIVVLNSPQKFPQTRNMGRTFALVQRPETFAFQCEDLLCHPSGSGHPRESSASVE